MSRLIRANLKNLVFLKAVFGETQDCEIATLSILTKPSSMGYIKN